MSKIVFFGNEQLAQGLNEPTTPIFDGLISSKNSVVALVLPRQSEIISRKTRELKIIESTNNQNIKIIYADQTNLQEALLKLGADIGVLASYGKIVPLNIIAIFPNGIVNIHPSLLPKYRGPTPLETAIADGERETGVSLMALSAKMDAGPVYIQEKIALSPTETKFTLYEKAANTGSKLLLANIDKIISGGLKSVAQDNTQASYCQLLKKSDGELYPLTMTATDCERKIRAYLGFPRTRLLFHGQPTIITKAKTLNDFAGDNWPDVITCRDNTA
ncbi:MAG: methionyl-tRNA formyltransferase, partial [Candidatus Nomurabacteria bacterium]|nr:methionyl-tRNA formyltransferase [Candidatus Nomurabacteria bacterium]